MEFEKKLIESCKRVYEQLGFGLMELTYEKGLKIELQSLGVKCDNEEYVNLYYEDRDNEKHFLTSLRMDIVVKKPSCVIELKTVKSVLKKDDKEYYQALRYQKITGVEKCYLVNFGIKGLEIYNCNDDDFKNLII